MSPTALSTSTKLSCRVGGTPPSRKQPTRNLPGPNMRNHRYLQFGHVWTINDIQWPKQVQIASLKACRVLFCIAKYFIIASIHFYSSITTCLSSMLAYCTFYHHESEELISRPNCISLQIIYFMTCFYDFWAQKSNIKEKTTRVYGPNWPRWQSHLMTPQMSDFWHCMVIHINKYPMMDPCDWYVYLPAWIP